MTITFPEGVEGEGNVKVAFIPAVADPDNPTMTEITAGTDVSCYITGDGFQPGGEQAVNEDRRLCSKQVFGVPGSITYTLEEITYVYDPQDPVDDNGENEAYVALAPGTTGFIAIRWGLDALETDWAADQVIDLFPVEMGAQFKNPPVVGGGGGGGGGGGSTTKLTVRQTPYVTGPANNDVSIVAP